MGDHEPRDPALTQLDDLYRDPKLNPIAFLPVEPVRYDEHTDWPVTGYDMDAQSRAYREMTDADVVPDDELHLHLDCTHEGAP